MSPRDAAVRDVLARYKVAGLVPAPMPQVAKVPKPPLANRSAVQTSGVDAHREFQKMLISKEPK